MCLAIPGKVIRIDETAEPRMGTASFGGLEKRVCLAWVPDIKIGDYVIVHVGFAISTLDEAAAKRALELIEQVEEVRGELRMPKPDA